MSDWSTLAEEADSHNRGPGPKCQVHKLLASLDADGAAEVQRVLDNKDVTTAGISRALRSRLGNKAPSMFSIGNHRRGNCRCGE